MPETCLYDHIIDLKEDFVLWDCKVYNVEIGLDMTIESSQGIGQRGGKWLKALTSQPNSYAEYLA
jgi:hypothetical protein